MQHLSDWLGEYDPEASAMTLLIIDIDHFKPINDAYGHLDGDHIIKALIATCAGQLAEPDLLARLGGEELAVALFDMSAQTAMRVAERLRRAVATQRFQLDNGTTLSVTISIGASVVRPHRRRVNDLLRDADDALYAAKRRGRNRVVMADGNL